MQGRLTYIYTQEYEYIDENIIMSVSELSTTNEAVVS